MKRLTLTLTLCLSVGSATAGTVVEYEHGHVSYAPRCPAKVSFVYFDGAQLQKPCIGSSQVIPHNKFLEVSMLGDCRRQVRVNHGTVEDGVLYATDIEPFDDCGGGQDTFPP